MNVLYLTNQHHQLLHDFCENDTFNRVKRNAHNVNPTGIQMQEIHLIEGGLLAASNHLALIQDSANGERMTMVNY